MSSPDIAGSHEHYRLLSYPFPCWVTDKKLISKANDLLQTLKTNDYPANDYPDVIVTVEEAIDFLEDLGEITIDNQGKTS